MICIHDAIYVYIIQGQRVPMYFTVHHTLSLQLPKLSMVHALLNSSIKIIILLLLVGKGKFKDSYYQYFVMFYAFKYDSARRIIIYNYNFKLSLHSKYIYIIVYTYYNIIYYYIYQHYKPLKTVKTLSFHLFQSSYTQYECMVPFKTSYVSSQQSFSFYTPSIHFSSSLFHDILFP